MLASVPLGRNRNYSEEHLSGEGEIWRRAPDGQEKITELVPGVCVDIPLGTGFQYRCTGSTAIIFTCTALPRWPVTTRP